MRALIIFCCLGFTVCFMLNFIYRAVHGGDKVAEVNQHCKQMLGQLEKEYLDVFSEPIHPLWEHRQPF